MINIFWLVYIICMVIDIIFVRGCYKHNNGSKSDWSPSLTFGYLILLLIPILNFGFFLY